MARVPQFCLAPLVLALWLGASALVVAWGPEDTEGAPAAAASSDAQLHGKLRKRAQQQLRLGEGFDVQTLKSLGEQLQQLAGRTDEVEVEVAARMDAFAVDRALARLLVRKSQLAFGDKEKRSALQQAREFVSQAQKHCVETIQVLQRQLDTTPLARDEDEREKWKKSLASAELSHALMVEEMADTYTNEEAERADSLRAAKAKYQQVYERYRTTLLGLYAQLYLGRVELKLQEYPAAVEVLESLLRLPNEPPAFETVKLKASMLLADCRLQQEEADLSAEASRLRKHLRGVSRGLQSSQDARRLRERLQTVERRISDEPMVAEKTEPPVISVSAEPGDEEVSPAEKKKIAEYRLAHAKVRETMARYQTAKALVETLELKQGTPPAGERDKEASENQQASFEAAELAAQSALAEAITACGKMLELGNTKASQRPTSTPLYYLSFLHMMTRDYVTAQLYAEDLARNQPLVDKAPQAAKITAACYLQRFKQATDPAEKSNLLRHFVAIEVYTMKTWPDSKEAQEAEATLRKMQAAQDAARANQQPQVPQE